MFEYLHAYIFYIHTHTHIYIYIYICMSVYIYIYIYDICIYKCYLHMYICTYLKFSHIHVKIILQQLAWLKRLTIAHAFSQPEQFAIRPIWFHAYELLLHTCMYTYIYIYICIYIYMYKNVYIYITCVNLNPTLDKQPTFNVARIPFFSQNH